MSKSALRSLMAAAITVFFCWAVAQAGTPAGSKAARQPVKAKTTTDAAGVATAEGAARMDIGPAPAGPYHFEAQVQLSEEGVGACGLVLADPKCSTSATLAQR